jgi:beta-N-acetylhexosaminidase
MKAAIIGLSGLEVTAAEAALMARHAPAGVILFGRNIAGPDQLLALTSALARLLPEGADIMVDQEGGRVARLRSPHFAAHPACRAIGDLAARDMARGLRAAWLHGAAIGTECHGFGFTLVAAPVLDRHVPGAHDVIGDRAFSADPVMVARLARAMAEGMLTGGVCPIGKHAPGHGRAGVDSHVSLPELDTVVEEDLYPFIANHWLPWLMTAHIRYRGEDMDNPATTSAKIIAGTIRGRIGFAGVLVSDDLAMQALSGDFSTRTRAALAAGCDIALHCSGVLADTEAVLAAAPRISGETSGRLARARATRISAQTPQNLAALLAERDELLGGAA